MCVGKHHKKTGVLQHILKLLQHTPISFVSPNLRNLTAAFIAYMPKDRRLLVKAIKCSKELNVDRGLSKLFLTNGQVALLDSTLWKCTTHHWSLCHRRLPAPPGQQCQPWPPHSGSPSSPSTSAASQAHRHPVTNISKSCMY